MNAYIVQLVNAQTGELSGTPPFTDKRYAIDHAERLLSGCSLVPVGKYESARVWEHPLTSANKGGVHNRVVWDSRFGDL